QSPADTGRARAARDLPVFAIEFPARRRRPGLGQPIDADPDQVRRREWVDEPAHRFQDRFWRYHRGHVRSVSGRLSVQIGPLARRDVACLGPHCRQLRVRIAARSRRPDLSLTASSDLLTVRFHALAFGGEAVGRADDGRVVFAPYAAPGDVAEVRVTE